MVDKLLAVRCECFAVTDPAFLLIVEDAWIDGEGVAHFEFYCPQCGLKNESKMRWDGNNGRIPE